MDGLEGDGAIEDGVEGLVDDAHGAAAQLAQYFVAPDGGGDALRSMSDAQRHLSQNPSRKGPNYRFSHGAARIAAPTLGGETASAAACFLAVHHPLPDHLRPD